MQLDLTTYEMRCGRRPRGCALWAFDMVKVQHDGRERLSPVYVHGQFSAAAADVLRRAKDHGGYDLVRVRP